jgi:hypothetical protein
MRRLREYHIHLFSPLGVEIAQTLSSFDFWDILLCDHRIWKFVAVVRSTNICAPLIDIHPWCPGLGRRLSKAEWWGVHKEHPSSDSKSKHQSNEHPFGLRAPVFYLLFVKLDCQ